MTVSATLALAHKWIDDAYAALARESSFIVRAPQLELSKQTAQALLEGGHVEPLLAEAPTGTGKTIAYILGALGASHVLGSRPVQPIVISTATKALQSQLLTQDLPRLAAAGLIALDDAAVAKGKGNYLCLSQADEVHALLENEGQGTFLDEGTSKIDQELVHGMIEAVRNLKWNGDFDAWEGKRPVNIKPIAVSSDTCNQRKCPNYNSCAYFRARNKLAGVKLIVANHDLILRDLMLANEGDGTGGSLPVSSYFIVFDEGHHLPEKAIGVGVREAHLSAFARGLGKLGGIQRQLKSSMELQRLMSGWRINERDFDRAALSEAVDTLMTALESMDVEEETGQRRFPRGVLPPALVVMLEDLHAALTPVYVVTTQMMAALRETMPDMDATLKEKATELNRRALDYKIHAKAVLECVQGLIGPTRKVKWLYRKDDTVSLHCSPLEGADVLRPILWESDRTKGVVITSATLRDIGGFNRFKARVGAPAKTSTLVLPYTFPYNKSVLTVAAMNATPKFAERKAFLLELREKLPAAINPGEATLVLFPSWAMMKELIPTLRTQFGMSAVLVQNDKTVPLLRKEHEARVKAGLPSILVGTQSLAEGLDLPGKLCEHVIIAAIPFAVPTEPVEQERSDLLGKDYFSLCSLPDAMVKLVQWVGRLLRRESDTGRVTIFDRRLATMSYGRKMLDQLPPFDKVIEKLAA